MKNLRISQIDRRCIKWIRKMSDRILPPTNFSRRNLNVSKISSTLSGDEESHIQFILVLISMSRHSLWAVLCSSEMLCVRVRTASSFFQSSHFIAFWSFQTCLFSRTQIIASLTSNMHSTHTGNCQHLVRGTWGAWRKHSNDWSYTVNFGSITFVGGR